MFYVIIPAAKNLRYRRFSMITSIDVFLGLGAQQLELEAIAAVIANYDGSTSELQLFDRSGRYIFPGFRETMNDLALYIEDRKNIAIATLHIIRATRLFLIRMYGVNMERIHFTTIAR